MTSQERRALRVELQRLVRDWARLWTRLPREAWGSLAETAYLRAETIAAQLDAAPARPRRSDA